MFRLQTTEFDLAKAPARALNARLAALLGREQLPTGAELAALRPAMRALIVGLSAWIGLVLVVTLAALLFLQFSRYHVPTWLAARGLATPNLNVRAMSRLDNIVQHPLFSRTRHAPVPAAPVVVPPPAPAVLDQTITLKGVFMKEGVAKAFVLTGQNPIGAWAKVNDEINGWKIIGIQPNQIVLDGQNQRLVVPLKVSR